MIATVIPSIYLFIYLFILVYVFPFFFFYLMINKISIVREHFPILFFNKYIWNFG